MRTPSKASVDSNMDASPATMPWHKVYPLSDPHLEGRKHNLTEVNFTLPDRRGLIIAAEILLLRKYKQMCIPQTLGSKSEIWIFYRGRGGRPHLPSVW